ncbi:MAG: two-component system sensor histidine kinase/response regulator [Planctomycetota bacterium]|jgi:two-component system sensor histidine kinase/response regulator
MSDTPRNRKILIVDDNPSIHEDFRKILRASSNAHQGHLEDARQAFFGEPEANPAPTAESQAFETESAHQGEEALEMVKEALANKTPYAMAFVDVRMPPGWDGVQTIQELWKADPELCVVICTAFSDYSWSQTIEALGQSDKLLILKKPFDSVEIRQLAHALVEKWNQTKREQQLISGLRDAEAQQRSYAASLETVNKALITSMGSAEQALALRGEFLLRLSSQVDESLTTIIDRVLATDHPEDLGDVLDASRHMLGVLNEVMDYNQLESGSVTVDMQPIELRPVLEGLLDNHAEHAKEKGLTVALEIAPGIPQTTTSDPDRLNQVLGVLMDNALRYTETGSVCIKVTTEHGTEWSDAFLHIDVCDTGPGIAPEFCGRIFEPLAFRNSGGSGVGLALAKRLARKLKGDLHLQSEVGTGSIFSLQMKLS